jgi:hypothetical protein
VDGIARIVSRLLISFHQIAQGQKLKGHVETKKDLYVIEQTILLCAQKIRNITNV